MTNSFPVPKDGDITQYEHIQCIRPADGLEIRAHRIVVDEQTPVRWTMVVEGHGWLDLGVNQGGTHETYSTSELIALAKNAGFSEWQQSAIAMVEGSTLVDGDYREELHPQFQTPDHTLYPPESGWVDVNFLHNKGLSDNTIAKLVQEDSSFQRVNGDIVQYDIRKVYGHPKVRAVMAKGGGAISYENILKD